MTTRGSCRRGYTTARTSNSASISRSARYRPLPVLGERGSSRAPRGYRASVSGSASGVISSLRGLVYSARYHSASRRRIVQSRVPVVPQALLRGPQAPWPRPRARYRDRRHAGMTSPAPYSGQEPPQTFGVKLGDAHRRGRPAVRRGRDTAYPARCTRTSPEFQPAPRYTAARRSSRRTRYPTRAEPPSARGCPNASAWSPGHQVIARHPVPQRFGDPGGTAVLEDRTAAVHQVPQSGLAVSGCASTAWRVPQVALARTGVKLGAAVDLARNPLAVQPRRLRRAGDLARLIGQDAPRYLADNLRRNRVQGYVVDLGRRATGGRTCTRRTASA